MSVSQVKESDDQIKAIWERQHSLKQFVDPSNFKTYDELKEKLNRVITGSQSTVTADQVDLPPTAAKSVKSEDVSAMSTTMNLPDSELDNDDDDTLSYFSKLADED